MFNLNRKRRMGFIFFMAFVMIGAGILALANFSFREKVKGEVEALFQEAQLSELPLISESDLEGLPAPIQRHLRFAGVIGKKRISLVRLRQRGRFRVAPDKPWWSMQAEQYFSVNPPALIWRASIKPNPFLPIVGRDLMRKGRGHMLIKMLSLVTVADARHPKLDQGVMTRYLAEMMWFPSAFLEDYLQWEEIDEHSSRVRFSLGDHTVAGVFYIDQTGEMLEFRADRFQENKSEFVLREWSTPVSESKELGGLNVPVKAKAVWKMEEGDFAYFDGEIVDLEYDPPGRYED